MCLVLTNAQDNIKPFVNGRFYKLLLTWDSCVFRSPFRQDYIWELGINKVETECKPYLRWGERIVTQGLHVFCSLNECIKEKTCFDEQSIFSEKIRAIEVFGNSEDLIGFGQWGYYTCAAFTKLRVDSFNDIS